MVWHYIENGQQAGPVDDATFRSMVTSGQITANTHVWREGMPNWAPYGSLVSAPAPTPVAGATPCAECGNYFPPEELVQIGNRMICAACKPIAVQKFKEGVEVIDPEEHRYAGFWIRFAANIVDGLIFGAVQIVENIFLGATARLTSQGGNTAILFLVSGINILLHATYSIWLIGGYGGTVGMMACGIKVVRANNGKVSYLLATGRFFAAILSGLPTLGIGYLMIAFDDEKRALHDRICETRVVYKR
ncbi:MAG TPA: RDD family protein [Chthoniobacteraceae bacterium]|nr:RDD family protein [Chthoniobacteraceae bacterium]